MHLRKKENQIEISFVYDPRHIAFIKKLDGRTYNPRTKRWSIPLIGAQKTVEELLKRGFQVVDPELVSALKQEYETENESKLFSIMTDLDFKSSLPLYPYQKVGAAFLVRIGSGILGDEPGLGKTVQSLAVCEKVGAQKVLILCPSAVKWQWMEEIKKFVHGSDGEICVIEGGKSNREVLWKSDFRFFVANYELLLRDFDVINRWEWDVIIADEATRIANPMAKQSKAIKKLRAKYRIAMTGTPVSNRANEIWNLVDFTNPGALGNYYSFVNRYCLKNQWGGIYGYQNMDELAAKLQRYMIRRQKADVLPELPEKIVSDVPFEMSDGEKALYSKLRKEILFEIEKEDIEKIESPMTVQFTLVKMLRLRQLADSMELLGTSEKSSKLEVLKDLLHEALSENNKKAIIFTQFAKMADILARELQEWGVIVIQGSVPDKDRQTLLDLFNGEEDQCRILVMTAAGQHGLNVQRASVIFHYDQEWSLAKMTQREGRAHRIGQKDTVLVYNLLAKGTIDYYVKKILHEKAALSDQILGDAPLGMNTIKDMLTYEE